MIRGIVLYYLSIKPTHGYEIQRFLQISGTDQWTKIQSGSIYYALTKLEKEKCIKVLREERTGSRVRKIYEITDFGRKELHREMCEELDTPLSSVGSPKFIIEPMISTLTKEEATTLLRKHIDKLKEQRDFWRKWADIKVDKDATKLTKLTFEMTITSLEDQIAWHEELLENVDLYKEQSSVMRSFIEGFDFDKFTEKSNDIEIEQKIDYIEQIKEAIKDNPDNAIGNLEKIIEELKRQL
ncbi:MAG TPA: PadR family transcriptional regulator [Lachnospiraceae bacterium]|nr:PadR family transcriptional regulator [Lachnospiraceae bacterium]